MMAHAPIMTGRPPHPEAPAACIPLIRVQLDPA
jgi:hypothetical protein